MKKSPKVLVGCPTYDGKAYALERYARRIKELDYPDFDILLVDTSDDNGRYRRKVERLGLPCVAGPKRKRADMRVAAARNVLRRRALEGGYDHYFSLEQDVIPRRDILSVLVAHRKDVVGGWYYTTVPVSSGAGGDTHYLKEPCLVVRRPGARNSDEHIWASKQQLEGWLCRRRLLKVHIGSFGACLVSRRALDKVSFHHDPLGLNHDDVVFYRLLEMRGIDAFIDTDMLVPHFQSYRAP